MCLLSIIMPVYNTQDTLPAALDGVCRQTLEDLEIILVDDGSTDGVSGILKGIGEQDERVSVFRQEHAGTAAARNAGLKMAKGRYIYFADADDVMAVNAARIMTDAMESSGADLVTFGFRKRNRRTRDVQEVTAPEKRFSGQEIRHDYTKWTENSSCKVLGSCWNKCFRRDLIEKHNMVFPGLSRNEEEVFIMRYLNEVKDVYQIPDVLYDFYPIGLKQAWERLPEDFCEQVDLFRKERMKYAVKWECDTRQTREFLAKEYWGKMMLGLRLCFNPKQKAGYGEFARRVTMLRRGLSELGEVPASVEKSLIYRLMKRGFTPLVWILVKRNSRG